MLISVVEQGVLQDVSPPPATSNHRATNPLFAGAAPSARFSAGITVLLSAALLLCSSACSRDSGRSRLDSNEFAASYIGDERIFLQDYWGMDASHLMFLPLVALGGDEFGDVQPMLAERWEHTADFREWTFFLRTDVKWHDGVPVTAHDVKFTLDLRKRFPHTAGGVARGTVNLLDDFAFTISFDEPTQALDTYSVYYPKHLLEDLDPEELFISEFWVHPVGNGPYRYIRHLPATMTQLVANPDYFRGRPRIETVTLKFSQEQSVAELLAGNVDALTYVGRDMLLSLPEDERFRSYHWWGSWTETVYWNHANPLFREASVRKALTMAIDRRELGRVLNYPDDVPILDCLVSRRQMRRGDLPDPIPYDPESARQLLDEAGWSDAGGHGARRNGENEFRFTALVNTQRLGDAAVFIQEQLREVGVTMEIQALEFITLQQRLQTGDFEAAMFRFSSWIEHPDIGPRQILGEESPIGYVNSDMVSLLNEAKITLDFDERDSVLREILPIFMEDVPLTLLLPQVQTYIVDRRIRGLSNHARPNPVWFAEYLWIENEN